MLVKDCMTPSPITIKPDSTHKRASDLMREQNVHHLPVVDKNEQLVGIVVYEDLIAAQPSAATTLSIYEIHTLLSKIQVQQIMSSPVFTTTADCPLEDAARLMLDQDIGCLPVMENDQLVGMITDTDIFQSLVMLLGGGEKGSRFTLQLPDKPGVLAKVAQIVADAGGNIISVTSWDSTADDQAYITIKVQGADFARVQVELDASEATVVAFSEQVNCEQKPYGAAS